MNIPIEIIILLLFFLLPAIARLLERMRGGPVRPPDSKPYDYDVETGEPIGAGPRQHAEDAESLEDALRQIREALGAPSPPPPMPPRQTTGGPSRTSSPPPLSPRTPRPTRPAPPARPAPPPLPTSPRPQRQPTTQPRRTPGHVHREARDVIDKFDLSTPLKVEYMGDDSENSWLVAAMRDREQARRAIKFHEVLEPPPSVKRLGFRRR